MRDWTSKLFRETISRTLAVFISGFLVAFALFLFSSDFAAFLRGEATVNVGMLLVLALFGLIGVATGLSGLWGVLARYRGAEAVRPRDERVEETQRLLLAKLAVVEAGPEIYGEHPLRDFRAELISFYDQWEGAVEPYVADREKEVIRQMRSHIQGRSLNHSTDEGAEWTQSVKDITYIARSNVPWEQ